jgi:hypothetical protein
MRHGFSALTAGWYLEKLSDVEGRIADVRAFAFSHGDLQPDEQRIFDNMVRHVATMKALAAAPPEKGFLG